MDEFQLKEKLKPSPVLCVFFFQGSTGPICLT